MDQRKPVKIYEFEPLGVVVDASDGTLRDRSGAPIDIRPQSRDVLRLLAQKPNETVTKDQFTEQVWDGRLVSDDSLVQCIAELRAAIGDKDRSVIQTVPRKGYRFAPPAPAPARAAPPPRRKPLLAVLALLIALGLAYWSTRPAPDRNRQPVVAVLPLTDMSAGAHKGYLSDALSEGIITELARFPQFQVIARNSSFQFRDGARDVREIGDRLHAGYVLEGSQQFDGAQIRVTVQLVDAQTGLHLFADQYERDLHDLFAVQDDIVRHVASVVGQTLLSELPVRVPPRDVDSRLRGLQARNIMTQLNYENWEKAMALEQMSIDREPQSAWGYIGKSLMLGAAAALGWREPREEVLQEATELAEAALQRAPENYMAHYTLARVLARQAAYEESLLHFERAADLNPSDSIIWIGMSVPLLYTGKTDQAIEVLERAAQVDPLHGDWLRWQQGLAHWQKGECEAGLAAMQAMSSPPAASNKALAAILVCLDRLAEAEKAMARFLEKNPEHSLAKETAAVPANWQPEGMETRWLEAMRASGLN